MIQARTPTGPGPTAGSLPSSASGAPLGLILDHDPGAPAYLEASDLRTRRIYLRHGYADRVYLVSMPRSATVEAPFTHKGTELVGVVGGLVQVLVGSGRPVLRRGETLLASRRGIDAWRNVGDSDAQCLWVLRD